MDRAPSCLKHVINIKTQKKNNVKHLNVTNITKVNCTFSHYRSFTYAPKSVKPCSTISVFAKNVAFTFFNKHFYSQ